MAQCGGVVITQFVQVSSPCENEAVLSFSLFLILTFKLNTEIKMQFRHVPRTYENSYCVISIFPYVMDHLVHIPRGPTPLRMYFSQVSWSYVCVLYRKL